MKRPAASSRPTFVALLPFLTFALFLALGPVASVVGAQGAAPDERFTAEERITVLDLVVGLGAPGTRPGQVRADDFTVDLAGDALPVVAAVGPEGGEPWEIRVWIDAATTSTESIHWAADLLAPRLERWTGLGAVSVTIADPDPRLLAPATDDPEALAAVFADLALLGKGRDELRTLRHDALALGDATGVVEAETELIRERADALVRWLVDEPPSRSRRALVVVAEGWDLDPARFYREAGLQADGSDVPLREDAERLAATLASYGWITVVVTPDPRDDLRPRGVRIGKWLLSEKGIWYQERKKPERADAYVELGEALLGQAKLTDAEDNFSRALHHYADDPKTAVRQARALRGLAEVFRRQGDLRRSRESLSSAAELDPSGAPSGLDAVAADLEARTAPLKALAEATSGQLVTNVRGLDETLLDLERRIRLTVQVEGRPLGEALEVEVARDGEPVRHPSRIRSGTPRRVAEARLRGALAGDATGGVLDVRAAADAGEVRGEAEVEAEDPDGGAWVRVTWAVGGPDVPIRFEHREVVRATGLVESRLVLETDDGPWVAVLVEELATGAWGLTTLDRND